MTEGIQELLNRITSLFYYRTIILGVRVIQQVAEPKLLFPIVFHQCSKDTASRVQRLLSIHKGLSDRGIIDNFAF